MLNVKKVLSDLVRQKWKNLKAVAVKVLAEISHYDSEQMDGIPLEV